LSRTAQFNGGETVHGQIRARILAGVEGKHGRQRSSSAKRFERRLLACPLRALNRDGLARHLVFQANLKIGSAHAAFPIETRDVELALLLLSAVGEESRRGEDEPERVDLIKLLAQLAVGVHGEHRRRHRDDAALAHLTHEVVFENGGSVVEEGRLHGLRTDRWKTMRRFAFGSDDSREKSTMQGV